jgi:4-amino-4-deoxy-L-arabinose transferase-like glycosyltransferase
MTRAGLHNGTMLMKSRWPMTAALAVLFVVVVGLMIGAMRQESATVDETVFLGAGWSYWHGYRYRLNPEHPPAMQLLAAVPAAITGVRLSPFGAALLNGQAMAETCERWDLRSNRDPLPTAVLFPRGPSFYHYPFNEQSLFGGLFVYSGLNDAERLLFWGRLCAVALTLLTGLLVFLWTGNLKAAPVGVLAAAMFLLNPVILAYGHIVQSDIGMALMFPLAVWMFARWIETPGWRTCAWAGLTAGVALVTKFTAVILVPAFLVLWLLGRRYRGGLRRARWKQILVMAGIAWGVVLLVYLLRWKPAPPIDAVTAARLGVPPWFVFLRPILIPSEFFKGLALTLQHAHSGHESYLNGIWSDRGWWYYFPLAFAMKTPLSFLLFSVAGALAAIRYRKELRFAELAAWAGAIVYLGCSMFSRANLGVRHVLPLYPLLAVGATCALSRWAASWAEAHRKSVGRAGGLFVALGLVSVTLSYPFYICYLNPLAGGVEYGYRHLLDSNYDWGQDVTRLKRFLDERGIGRIYLCYFGTQQAIEYYRIPNDFVDSPAARQIREGYLVISAQALMRPEWNWLRESYQPVARVGYTLFVYRFGIGHSDGQPDHSRAGAEFHHS